MNTKTHDERQQDPKHAVGSQEPELAQEGFQRSTAEPLLIMGTEPYLVAGKSHFPESHSNGVDWPGAGAESTAPGPQQATAAARRKKLDDFMVSLSRVAGETVWAASILRIKPSGGHPVGIKAR